VERLNLKVLPRPTCRRRALYYWEYCLSKLYLKVAARLSNVVNASFPRRLIGARMLVSFWSNYLLDLPFSSHKSRSRSDSNGAVYPLPLNNPWDLHLHIAYHYGEMYVNNAPSYISRMSFPPLSAHLFPSPSTRNTHT
jgi:hypothetical protein